MKMNWTQISVRLIKLMTRLVNSVVQEAELVKVREAEKSKAAYNKPKIGFFKRNGY